MMACKSPPNFRDLHRKCCQPQQRQRPAVEVKSDRWDGATAKRHEADWRSSCAR
jgi:hypothetical protein